jgi:hypothetical protein
MPGGYYTCGKQVLWGGGDIAQARDNATAVMIADALNLADGVTDPIMPELVEYQPDAVDELRDMISNPAIEIAPKHIVRRENDGSYACSCGVRWDADEGSDHP